MFSNNSDFKMVNKLIVNIKELYQDFYSKASARTRDSIVNKTNSILDLLLLVTQKDTQQIVEQVAEELIDNVPNSKLFVALIDEERKLRAFYWRGLQKPKNRDQWPIGLKLIRHVSKYKEAVTWDITAVDAGTPTSADEQLKDLGARSAMCVPILGKEDFLGVFYLENHEVDRSYNELELRYVIALSGVIGHYHAFILERVTLERGIEEIRGQKRALSREVQVLRDERIADDKERFAFNNIERKFLVENNIIGTSEPFLNALHEIDIWAPTSDTILFQGPTGSGKTVLAKILHIASNRKGPFIATSLISPDEMILPDLLGVSPGYATGSSAREGLIRMADKGTLFIDEADKLSLKAQAALLKIVEEKKVAPMGTSKYASIDVRFVFASNQILSELAKRNEFRFDLFQRIAYIIQLPSLEERRKDMGLHIDQFVEERLQAENIRGFSLSSSVRECLLRKEYPGGLRELKHIVHSLVMLSKIREITVETVEEIFRKRYPLHLGDDPHRKASIGVGNITCLQDLLDYHAIVECKKALDMKTSQKDAITYLGTSGNTFRKYAKMDETKYIP